MHGRKVWNTAAAERLLSAPSCNLYFAFPLSRCFSFCCSPNLSLSLACLYISLTHACQINPSIHIPTLTVFHENYTLKGDRQSYPSWHMSHLFLPLPVTKVTFCWRIHWRVYRRVCLSGHNLDSLFCVIHILVYSEE